MKKLLCALSLVCVSTASSFAQAQVAKCGLFEGPQSQSSLEFDGQTAVLDGVRMKCGRVAVRLSSVRDFPEGPFGISFSCGPKAELGPSLVSVYAQGWMAEENPVFYAKVKESIFRCTEVGAL